MVLPILLKYAMESKIRKKTGFTIVELLIVVSIVLVLVGVAVLTFSPAGFIKRGRDEQRISDLALLERVINEYKLDTGTYPDSPNTLRTSTSLPAGNSGPAENAADGWIDADFSVYNTRLPTDPINDANYYYSYQTTGYSYELSTPLEYEHGIVTSDGGDDDTQYEVGDDLTII